MKKILFITGTRADFGKLRSLMEKVEQHENFELQIFATGMHTLSRYGSTYEEIKKFGFSNIFLHINQMVGQPYSMDLILANTVQGLGHYVREFQPDLIVVHGDRVEALAGAIVGALNNILVAHIEGGEVSGTIDELVRHSASKLSHIHLVANLEAKKRLIQMGETPDSIYIIGSPDIDIMLSDQLPTIEEVKAKYEIDFDEYYICAFHPVTTEINQLTKDVKELVSAIKESDKNFIIIYPNNDPGADIILNHLEELEEYPKCRMFPSIRFEYFLTLMKESCGIIGNSSAGIREAPVYGIPTLDIGSRQNNRFKYKTIFNIDCEKQLIIDGIKNLPPKSDKCFYFGDGKSSQKFLEIIKDDSFWKIMKQKQFQDILFNHSI